MKMKSLAIMAITGLMVASLTTAAWAAPPKYKMTTEIPANVITPDKVETSIGTLEFNDGFPTEETAKKVWDNLDFVRAVEAMIMTTPAASLVGFRKGIRDFGPDNETMIYWNGRLDPRGLTSYREYDRDLWLYVGRFERWPHGDGDATQCAWDRR